MALLRSSSALHTPSKPVRQDSSSSNGSTSSSDTPIEYVEPSPPPPPEEARTVRKGKDYRPTSSFWSKNKRDMTHQELVCNLATAPTETHIVKPETLNRGPVPVKSILPEQFYIITRGMLPMVIQAASSYFFPNYQWPTALAYTVYYFSFIGFALGVVRRLNYFCVKLGVFDEKNFGRDRTPDKSVNGLAKGIHLYMLLRTAMPFYFYYDKNVNPITSFEWSYPIRLAAWQLTLDYFFYVYHRLSHEVDSLWFIHQHHHTTKHPTAILAILAGDYQECIEIALVPLIATMLIPMSFSELYMTLCVTLYVEMLGHSGVRARWDHPVLWPLKYLDMDLCVEDHDLHHRYGKSGKNFGKQSRVWDRLFFSTTERLETFGI